jgi:ABC-type uncharacterized transport system ATPase subunit
MSDKAMLTDKEVAEVNALMTAIEKAMENLYVSDMTAIMALAEQIAFVVTMHSAGQVVYEGKNAAEAVSRNTKAVMEVVSDALARAIFKFPNTLAAMKAAKAQEESENAIIH